jgi:hypothetical protein
MSVSAQARAAVRATFGGRCAYCGVTEASVGAELEIDHFVPLSAGGSDHVDNLVYACTVCNRFKSDYATGADAPDGLRLLHPGIDAMDLHLVETESGRMSGLTPRGWFHVQRLHLNRPQLVEMRKNRRLELSEKQNLAQALEANARLQRQVVALQEELAELRKAVLKRM